ncbi:hypothetical protein DLE01_19935 [Streptomyces sp. FT05W]|nr:helix-turn-helix transcriptional regulator [Streptomyces sp. FT05W]PWS50157.1 hypothetical protein DLE01_19935 [Streptomyces sp. FT05W]
MGRPVNPIPNPKSAVGRLAQHLRDGLARHGLSYQELAALTRYHPTTLQRAADGKRISSWEVVEEFARGCGLAIPKARTLWVAARNERLGRRAPRNVPGVEQIYNYADLGVFLTHLREKHGGPPPALADRPPETGPAHSGLRPAGGTHRA